MNSLPSSCDYQQPIPLLPENSITYNVSLNPLNGTSFSNSGQIIQFQLGSRGFLIPDSVYLKFKCAVVNGATAGCGICCTPCYSYISKVETLFGSVSVDNINSYNTVANMLVNLTQDVASKYGSQLGYGYNSATSTPTMEELDGRSIAANTTDTAFYSCPLPCMITNSDKRLPLFAMPNIMFQLTTANLNDIIFGPGGVASTISSFTLSNVELVYSFIDMGAEVEMMVRNMGQKIYIKSQSFSQSSVSVPIGTSGSSNFVFSQRLASIKSAFVHFSSGNVGNRIFDALDITTSTAGAGFGGDYSITIGSVNYPQKPLSTAYNKAGLLQELRRAIGSIYDKSNSMSINTLEFSYLENFPTTYSTLTAPAKMWLGFALEKLHSRALLTGISSAGTNVVVNVNLQTPTILTHACNLILMYDALIEIDVINKQAYVKV